MEKGRNKFIIISVLFVLLSCSKSTDISSYIERTDKKILDLQELTNEKIDNVYIFGEYTGDNDISKIIGFEYEGEIIQDSQYLILLVSNKKVVYKDFFYEKKFEFSRKYKHQYKNITYRKYDTSKFKINNKFKRLTPIE
jgi:hypothetical protein